MLQKNAKEWYLQWDGAEAGLTSYRQWDPAGKKLDFNLDDKVVLILLKRGVLLGLVIRGF